MRRKARWGKSLRKGRGEKLEAMVVFPPLSQDHLPEGPYSNVVLCCAPIVASMTCRLPPPTICPKSLNVDIFLKPSRLSASENEARPSSGAGGLVVSDAHAAWFKSPLQRVWEAMQHKKLCFGVMLHDVSARRQEA